MTKDKTNYAPLFILRNSQYQAIMQVKIPWRLEGFDSCHVRSTCKKSNN